MAQIKVTYSGGTYHARLVGNSRIRASATSGELQAARACAEKAAGDQPVHIELVSIVRPPKSPVGTYFFRIEPGGEG